jgi:2-octaprenyl-6-methoxyphenol hydroxylase
MAASVELLVVGGGLNGLLLAVACAGAGLDTMLVDRDDPAAMQSDKFDGRCSALAYGSQQVFAALGLWSGIAAEAQPILEIRVADDAAPWFLHYDHRNLDPATPLGWIVENRVLRRALFARAGQLPNLAVRAPATVTAVERAAAGAGAGAILADGGRIGARLVAAADGKGSPLRRAARIGVVEWRYPQTGIVTTVAHQLPHRGVAVEHFLPAGPFAILPLVGERSSIVWTEREELAPRLLALPEAAFAAEVASRFGDFLGQVAPIGPRWSYELSLLQAESYVAARLALIGEAAHVIHPIAGQGLNIGIRDVAALAELVVDRRRCGLDIGDDALLAQYQRWRRFDATLLAAVTDGLNRLFSNAVAPIGLLRDIGLAMVDRLPPVKRFLMRDAMGMTGDLPRLVRGQAL